MPNNDRCGLRPGNPAGLHARHRPQLCRQPDAERDRDRPGRLGAGAPRALRKGPHAHPARSHRAEPTAGTATPLAVQDAAPGSPRPPFQTPFQTAGDARRLSWREGRRAAALPGLPAASCGPPGEKPPNLWTRRPDRLPGRWVDRTSCALRPRLEQRRYFTQGRGPAPHVHVLGIPAPTFSLLILFKHWASWT